MPVGTRSRRSINSNDQLASLQDLPAELLSRIVNHLTKEDAANLAVVCKGAQCSAEVLLWESVDLSLSMIYETYDAKEPGDDERVLEPKRKNIWLGERRDNGIRARLNQITLAFQHQPRRPLHVRRFKIEPCQLVNPELAKLVAELWPGLERLHIDARSHINIYDNASLQDHLRPFYRSRYIRSLLASDKLRDLEIGLSNDWEEELLHFFRIAPSLSSLKIAGIEGDAHPLPAPKSRSWPNSLPALRELTVHDFGDVRKAIPILLEKANNLEYLKYVGDKNRGLKDPLGAAIRNHPNLKRFEFNDDFDEDMVDKRVRKLFWKGGFEMLETLVTSSSIHTEIETVIQRLEIPPFPNLRTLIYPCRDWPWRMGDPMGYESTCPPETIEPISVEQLRCAPHLERIIFAQVWPKTFNTDPLEVDKWCERRLNGILIRSYINGNEQFIHTRRMELQDFETLFYEPMVAADYGYTEPIVRPPCQGDQCEEHTWVDQTVYDGWYVDEQVLKRVYEVMGEDPNWTTGGRDLTMPEEAWEVLRQGRRDGDQEIWWGTTLDDDDDEDDEMSQDDDGDPTETTPGYIEDWYEENGEV